MNRIILDISRNYLPLLRIGGDGKRPQVGSGGGTVAHGVVCRRLGFFHIVGSRLQVCQVFGCIGGIIRIRVYCRDLKGSRCSVCIRVERDIFAMLVGNGSPTRVADYEIRGEIFV